MNLLLDTHVLLWWLDDPNLLSQQAMETIKQPDNFDRLLIAQANIENLTFVTRDSRIKAYSILLLNA